MSEALSMVGTQAHGSWYGICRAQLVSHAAHYAATLAHGSWTAMAASLNLALPSGGPTAVIWGIVPSFIGNLCMAASLAEM